MSDERSRELERLVAYFEHLTRADVARIGEFYTEDASFKDPFNEVRGHAALRRVFDHMFDQVHDPRFVIHEAIGQGDQAFLVWDFIFRMKRFDAATTRTVRGSSHLRFAADGRLRAHRDYWDVAEELYEKLPLVGALMRWLKRKAVP